MLLSRLLRMDFRPIDVTALKNELKDIMWNHTGILRDEKTLKEGLDKLERLSSKFPRTGKCQTKAEYEFKNMLTVAKLITMSALNRKESRGAHYRLDYLQTNEESEHSYTTKYEGEICFAK